MDTELRQDGTRFTLPIKGGEIGFTTALRGGEVYEILTIQRPGKEPVQPGERCGFAVDPRSPELGMMVFGLGQDGKPHHHWRCAPYALPLRLGQYL